MRYWRTIKWLIFGLEVPILSILGLLVGRQIAGDDNSLEGFLGMVLGATIGLISGSLILYLVALRTYTKDKQVIGRKTSFS